MRKSSPIVLCFLAAGLSGGAAALSAHARHRANPIRKVVQMLQMMEQKVQKEGEHRKKLFDKFMCYCKTSRQSLEKSISGAEDKIPQLESDVKEATYSRQQLQEDLKQHRKDRDDAMKTLGTSAALRSKTESAFASEINELSSNMKAVHQAIDAIEKGLGNFLQTSAAAALRGLSVSRDLSSADRDALSSFLVGGAPAPSGGEVVGILKQMHDEMAGDLEEVKARSASTIASQESLVVSKKRELAASSKAVEEKTQRAGELAVEVRVLSNDLEDTRSRLAEDRQFLADLQRSCAAKSTEWELYSKAQAMELVALAEVVKLLSDDDALELFKKMLPGPGAVSLLQVSASSSELRQAAQAALRAAPPGDPRMGLLEDAARGRKVGLDGLLAKIDELLALLREEQKDEDTKRAFCTSEIGQAGEKSKELARAISNRKTGIADREESLAEVNRGIQALLDGIKGLDEQVSKATRTRQAEHAESVEALAANTAAKSLLEMAKGKLFKFYNKKPHQQPGSQPATEADRILVQMAGTMPSQRLTGGIADTGVMALEQEQSHVQQHIVQRIGPPPEADLDYIKKTEESGGVIAMVDLLRADLSKKITVLQMEEKQAQEDYETFVKDSSAKRALDLKALAHKEGAKAEMEATLHEERQSLKFQQANEDIAKRELASLHADCDWLLQNFGLRQQARAEEVDALQNAKAVLSGADYG